MEINGADTAWVLTCAALVAFMTPGLALFYGGMVRGKNVLAMLLQNFWALGIISVIWAVVGFSLAFGGTNPVVGNLDFAFLGGLTGEGDAIPGIADFLTVPNMAFVAYQMMFAIITPALITGATADRLKFGAYTVFIGIWSILVYSTVAHWVFSPSGWLFELGALDFAGGAVVHINAGAAALALVMILGPRRGWPREAMLPHSLPLTLIGTGILWFGWFGFNAGSALGANALASQALINTHLAAAAATCTWLLVEKLKTGHATTLGGASGAVAGLVAITPCAGFVNTTGALAIGALAGVICYLALKVKFWAKLDDSLDVLAVHLVGGLLGSILLGLFADPDVNPVGEGLLFGGGLGLLGDQLIASVSVLAFSFGMSFAIGKAIDLTMGLRVEPEVETMGLDRTLHAETAYITSEA